MHSYALLWLRLEPETYSSRYQASALENWSPRPTIRHHVLHGSILWDTVTDSMCLYFCLYAGDKVSDQIGMQPYDELCLYVY